MNNLKIYSTLGIMTGTSMDGIDLSLIKTDGKDYVKIICEYNYKYPLYYQLKLKNIIKNKPNNNINVKKYFSLYDNEITKIYIKYINNFIDKYKIEIKNIDLIGLSGQTMYHNPGKNISIQLGSGRIISDYFKIKVVNNFRKKDIINKGEGAPIGSYYHRCLLKNINKNAIIINLGGIANFTQLKKRTLISSDLGPANIILDDLTNYFYNEKFDKDGKYSSKGIVNKKILKKFMNDNFFKKNEPKSLDRNYFNLYFSELIKLKKNDALATALSFTLFSIINTLNRKSNTYIDEIILTGGGRKNDFLIKKLKLKLKLKNLKFNTIDRYGLNGDLIESQMFGYLAVRCIKKYIISTPLTTGTKRKISGGEIYFPNKENYCPPIEPGMLVFFPGTLEFLHGVKEVTEGTRYTIASFFTRDKSKADFYDRERKEN